MDDSIIDATITKLKEKLAGLDPVLQQQRKFATILFMDITGSTALTADLDPEEQMVHVIGQLLGYGFHDSPHLAAILEDPQQLRDLQLVHREWGSIRWI